MELSYREDWKIAKGVIICEAGKLFFFMTKSAQMGRFRYRRKCPKYSYMY